MKAKEKIENIIDQTISDANASTETANQKEMRENRMTDEAFDVETTEIKAPEVPLTAAQRLAAIEALEMPRKKAKDLLGQKFDILGAVRTKINGDDCVTLKVRLDSTGEVFGVTKALTVFTDAYVDYFEAPDAEPILARTFVELLDVAPTAGNHPITVRAFSNE